MLIKARVTPGSRKESIEKEAEGLYRIKVREPAEQNRANIRARELLAVELGVGLAAVKLIAGQRGQTKRFEVTLKVKN